MGTGLRCLVLSFLALEFKSKGEGHYIQSPEFSLDGGNVTIKGRPPFLSTAKEFRFLSFFPFYACWFIRFPLSESPNGSQILAQIPYHLHMRIYLATLVFVLKTQSNSTGFFQKGRNRYYLHFNLKIDVGHFAKNMLSNIRHVNFQNFVLLRKSMKKAHIGDRNV